jgi:hypothetical protein
MMNNENLRVNRCLVVDLMGSIRRGRRTFLEKGTLNISESYEQVLEISSHWSILSSS